MRTRGVALVNLLVAMCIGLVVALTAAGLFQLLTRMETETTSSYLLARDVGEAVRQIRLDLRETALAAVRVYPTASGSSVAEAPGMSLITARDDDGATQVGPTGGPLWKRHVYYTLSVPKGSLGGELIRWEAAAAMDLPQVATVLPSALPTGSSPRRTLLKNVAAPNATLTGIGTKGSRATDSRGGFDVQFVRSGATAYETSPWNPAQASTEQAGAPGFSGNTRMVRVALAVYQSTQTGAADYFSVSFYVTPSY